ncbi:AcrR family transcriptional regulator [Amycolatopsis bartoniae]|uniref:TetR family transcriptional regulator n=1 Tax=Amycolatopsis bartoniae TaxID=941986 RepID=A0A8H9IXM7_9PSEU|nr:TetR/AcrR family transcriptional regulator [Amycolatopsis bartoniae]MBB2934497.1 AcrR family transcriptional regulator [Amycolatopsis bartoniae]TVT01876.1 TetR/AcrR family transcriptional regulator [Amycolatopsis bartoniae]GHF46968.1 TetR family transcriptional regulator [Amycolatopsis bartoniae]
MTTSRSRRPSDRKNQLAACAAELFRARGYHGVGINDIAAAAGVTGPALYRHFADKQAVLAYVLLSGVRDMETETTRALSALKADDEQVERLLTGIASASVERRDVAALWRWEGRHLSPRDQREIGRRSSAILTSWAKVLMERRPELAAADAELLCWAALSVFGSVSVHHTTVAKRRFVQLLAGLAQRVLQVDLPSGGEPEPSVAAPGLGTPSRREQLLTCAAELFRRNGFHDVSMEDIGAAAGIAGPSVYRHFPSKASLVQAIARRAADRLALATEEVLRGSSNERAALGGLVDSYVRVLTGSPELIVSFSIDGVNLAEQDRVELLRVQRDYVAQWVSLLCAAQPELPAREAKIIVHAALTIANDLARTRRLNARPSLPAELKALMKTVLGV